MSSHGAQLSRLIRSHPWKADHASAQSSTFDADPEYGAGTLCPLAIQTGASRRVLCHRAAFGEILADAREAARATERFVQVIRERTGLLVDRGEGVYAVSHLTFQEYLAALAVAARDDYLDYSLQRAPDPW